MQHMCSTWPLKREGLLLFPDLYIKYEFWTAGWIYQACLFIPCNMYTAI